MYRMDFVIYVEFTDEMGKLLLFEKKIGEVTLADYWGLRGT